MSKYLRALIASVLGTAAAVECFFFSDGFNALNFTILFYVLLLAFMMVVGLPPRGSKNRVLHYFIFASILVISSTYTLFDNRGLHFLNGLSISVLIAILCLGRIGEDRCAIGSKGFVGELFSGFFVRPLLCIPDPVRGAMEFKKERLLQTEPAGTLTDGRNAEEPEPVKKRMVPIILQILAALMIGLPLVLILAVLLASSDAVFADFMEGIIKKLDTEFFANVILRLILFVIVIPFMASTMFSYKNHRLFSQRFQSGYEEKPKLIPEASAITILVLVNILYLIYAAVQSVYLFGAWADRLPDGLTYAEYARKGFFELAFVSAINAIMLLVSIRYTNRRGKVGIAVRVLSVVLIALSAIQLASAFRRMALYIEAYGLSEDRFLVSAFMILMAVLFLFLGICEFKEKFPLLKSSLITAVAALLIVNFCVPNHLVATYNVDRFLNGDLASLDIDYLKKSSADSVLVLLDREEELMELENSKIDEDLTALHDYISDRYYDNHTGDAFIDDTWKSFNISSYRVLASSCLRPQSRPDS